MLRWITIDRSVGAAVTTLALAFGIFFLLPFLGLIDRALEDGNFWDIVSTSEVADALWLTLWTSTVTVCLAVLLGTPVAFVLARRDFRGKTLIDALIDLPIVLPPTVAGVALLTAFGRRGLIGEPIDELTGFTFGFRTLAVIMAQFFVASPFYIRAVTSGFHAADRQLERVAHTLGASETRTFFRILVPQAWPAVIAGVVLTWARAMGELGATLIFAGNLQGVTQTMPLAILEAFEGTSLGLAGAVAMSLLLLFVALVVLVTFRFFTRRERAAL